MFIKHSLNKSVLQRTNAWFLRDWRRSKFLFHTEHSEKKFDFCVRWHLRKNDMRIIRRSNLTQKSSYAEVILRRSHLTSETRKTRSSLLKWPNFHYENRFRARLWQSFSNYPPARWRHDDVIQTDWIFYALFI